MGYSFGQLEGLWIQAGGSRSAAPIAAAVALAESSGDPRNVGDGGTSYGLWQVHLPAHPQYSASQMQNPLENAKAAVQISGNGTNWHPWTTYNTGAYQQYLHGGSVQPVGIGIGPKLPFNPANPGIPGLPGPGDLPNPLDGLGGVSDSIGTLSKLIRDFLSPQFWIDVAKVIFGGLLLLIFGYTLVKDTGPAKAAKSLAKDSAVAAAI